MRDDFAVFILTHGRADKILTMNGVLKTGNYTGKWYMILDNEDDQYQKYVNKFGKEHVIVFNKNEVAQWTDTADNFNEHRAIIYARNQSFYIAKNLGLKYFMMLDDDFTGLHHRFIEDGQLKAKKVTNFDRLCEDMIQFLEDTGAITVAFCQAGDFIGGAQCKRYNERCIRKAMNSFFCKVDKPFQFVGTMNEDVTMYTTLGSRGKKIFSITDVAIVQAATQSLDGGMSEVYRETGTYMKAFYTVMAMPGAVHVGMMHSKHERIHHHVNWNKCVPRIISDKYRRY